MMSYIGGVLENSSKFIDPYSRIFFLVILFETEHRLNKDDEFIVFPELLK